jgi:dephospho-CoA kinase
VYTTIFLNIPEDILKQRIEKRGAFMSDEELKKRLKSALFEEEQARVLCDHMIDATRAPEQVLQEVLKIIQK